MNDSTSNISDEDPRISEYECCLLRMYGVIIVGKDLRHILGYRTSDAFRQAVRKKSLPFYTFIPKGRRVRMARTRDVAKWLASIDADIDELASNRSENDNG